MTALRANFGDLLAPGFMDVYHEEFDRYPDEYTQIFNPNPETPVKSSYTQIFNLKNSKRQYEDLTGVSGFGLVPDKNEGEPTTYDDPIQGFNRRLTHTTRSLGFRVTEEMWEDDLYDVMVEMPRALGYSMKQTIETALLGIAIAGGLAVVALLLAIIGVFGVIEEFRGSVGRLIPHSDKRLVAVPNLGDVVTVVGVLVELLQ